MGMRRWTRVAILVAGASACAAPSGCSSSTSAADGVVGDASVDAPDSPPVGDVPAATDGLDAPDGPACPLTLELRDPMDDPDNGIALMVPYNSQRFIRIGVRACYVPVPDQPVTFAIVEDPKGVFALVSDSSTTGPDGDVLLGVGSPQEDRDGDGRIEACVAPGDCLEVKVRTAGCCVSPLIVQFAAYTGSYPLLSTGKVKLFKKSAAAPTLCADLKADALPSALAGVGPIDLQTAAKFETLPNLETELKQSYTVFCTATETGTEYPVKAYGCVDDVDVEFQSTKHVECPLNDIPPRLVGTYNVTTTLDLGTSLPPQVEVVGNFLIELVSSPTDAILKMMCDPAIQGGSGSQLESLCGYVFNNPDQPDVTNLTTIGTIVRGILDGYWQTHATNLCPDPSNPDSCSWIDAPGPGDALWKPMLRSRMTCLKEPDSAGLVALGGCTETWDTAVFRWWTPSLGCQPNIPPCGEIPVPLASIAGIGGSITAPIEVRRVEQNSKLAITRHEVGLKYGALLDYAMEKVLLPNVYGDGTGGLPAVDSIEAMIAVSLAGNACLVDQSCCHAFAADVVAQSGGAVTVNLVEGACDQWVANGGSFVRGLMTGLDTPATTFWFGTPVADGSTILADEPCAILDANGDMKIDELGLQAGAQQCVWDVEVAPGDGSDYPLRAFFWGVRD